MTDDAPPSSTPAKLTQSAARLAYHILAYAGTVLITAILTAGFATLLTFGVGGIFALNYFLNYFPTLAAATLLAAIPYALIMEAWHWPVERKTFGVTLFSALAAAVSSMLMVRFVNPFDKLGSGLLLLGILGAIVGTFVGILDWLGFALSKPPTPPSDLKR